jgi:pimeloyl-ACP methyl ester carboxylesterase
MISVLVATVAVAIIALPWWRNPEKKRLDDSARANAPGQFIKLDYGRVHYQLSGSAGGELVVLLNGFSVPLYVWERNVSHLADNGYQVLQLDFWGRGYSDRPDTDYDKHLFIAQLDHLVRGLGLENKPLNLVGLSMGGAVAAAYASAYPERVASTTFMAPLHKPISLGPLLWPGIGRWLAYTLVIPRFAQKQADDLVAHKEVQHWIDNYKVQMSYKGIRRALYSTFAHFMQDDPLPDFRSLADSNIDSLLFWGDQDKMFPIAESARVREALGSHHQFIEVKGAAHALQFEKADQINEALVAFLRRNEGQ